MGGGRSHKPPKRRTKLSKNYHQLCDPDATIKDIMMAFGWESGTFPKVPKRTKGKEFTRAALTDANWAGMERCLHKCLKRLAEVMCPDNQSSAYALLAGVSERIDKEERLHFGKVGPGGAGKGDINFVSKHSKIAKNCSDDIYKCEAQAKKNSIEKRVLRAVICSSATRNVVLATKARLFDGNDSVLSKMSGRNEKTLLSMGSSTFKKGKEDFRLLLEGQNLPVVSSGKPGDKQGQLMLHHQHHYGQHPPAPYGHHRRK